MTLHDLFRQLTSAKQTRNLYRWPY